MSRITSPKDLEDLCLNIYEDYTAIEFEIAKRDPLFAVVSNLGYAPFHSQSLYLLQQRDQSGRAPVKALRL